MAPSKIRKALGRVKDQTSIGIAKVGGSTLLSDLDVAIVKATRHEEYPADERYIREILTLTSNSRGYVSACVNTISNRLNKTRTWTVALKALMLIHRLLSDGDPAYEQEIFFSTRRGTRILNLSDFRDSSRSDSWDFSAFVRTYALYLDESLEFKMQGMSAKRIGYGKYEEEFEEEYKDKAIVVRSTPVHEMKTKRLFQRIQQLQLLLERFLACRPTGEAKCNRVVTVALYPIVKESIQMYFEITEALGALIDRFVEADMTDSVKIYDVFCLQSKQFDELDSFYSWCRSIGIARPSEFPEIEKITRKKLDLLDELIRDKSALAQGNAIKDEPVKELEYNIEEPKPEPESEPDYDINAVKLLLFPEEESVKEDEIIDNSMAIVVQPEGDLLNLGEDAMYSEDHADVLARALFDGEALTGPPRGPVWEDFGDDVDWETALVLSASALRNQKPTLGGGFDELLLNGLYQQGQVTAAMAKCTATGSASSVAFGSVGRPAMLALPAPPSSSICVDPFAASLAVAPPSSSICVDPFTASLAVAPPSSSICVDPFTASLAVAPPSYVQLSDMEKKQNWLVEEQVMWEQYRRNGMQGMSWYTHG